MTPDYGHFAVYLFGERGPTALHQAFDLLTHMPLLARRVSVFDAYEGRAVEHIDGPDGHRYAAPVTTPTARPISDNS